MMRWATFWFAVATGAATFSVVAIWRAAGGHPEFVVGYVYLFFAGFGVGWAVFLGLDAWDLYLDHAASREKTYADAELQRAKAESARTAKIESVAPNNTSRSPLISDLGQVDSLNDEWLSACHRFLRAGEVVGFPIRVMVARGIVSWDDWGKLASCLADAGVMVKSPRAGWASGWDMGRWLKERHNIALPHGGAPAPEVALIPTTTTTTAPTTTVEGVARTAD